MAKKTPDEVMADQSVSLRSEVNSQQLRERLADPVTALLVAQKRVKLDREELKEQEARVIALRQALKDAEDVLACLRAAFASAHS